MSRPRIGYWVLSIARVVVGSRWSAVIGLLLLVTVVWDFGPGMVGMARKLLRGSREDAWQQVQAGGAIRFGVDSNDWPFAAANEEGYVGLNVDLGRALADALGVQADFVPVGYDGAYDALRLGQCDALIGVLENDPARLGDFIYTGSYFDAGQVVISLIGTLINADDADINLSAFIRVYQRPDLQGKRIAVELGSEADAAARWLARRTLGVTLVERDSANAALEAVRQGQADVGMADAVWARQAVSKEAGWAVAPGSVWPYPLALAVRADSARLQSALSRALAQLEVEGKLAAILSRWLDK